MSEQESWPSGVEQRRPRVSSGGNALVAGSLIGASLGALFGIALSGDARETPTNAAVGTMGGALAGGLVGATVTTPLSLERSLQIALDTLGASFVSLRRHGRHRANLVFQANNGFRVSEAKIEANTSLQQADIDDLLYRHLVLSVARKMEVVA